MATQASMAYHTNMSRGEAQSKLSMLVNLSEAQPKHGITLSAAQQLKDLVLFCPKPYFRLVNSSKQLHKHKLHEKLIKLHIRHTPNGVTVKKIEAIQVTGTICQHQEAHFRAMHKQVNECKYAHN